MNIFPLAFNTLKETIRDKILYTILLFAILMIGSGILLSYLSLGQENKIVLDLGLSSINIFGLIVTIFVGTSLLSKEIDKKTIYLLLSKPLRRLDFIFGKYLGLCLTLFIIVACMSIAYFGVSWYTSSSNMAFLNTVYASSLAIMLIYIELMLLIAVAIFFSTFSSPVLSAMFTLSVYVMGHLSNDMISFGKLSQNASLETITRIVFYVLPDLERLNLKNLPLTETLPPEIWLSSVAYGLMYALALLCLSVIIFERREF